MRLPVPSPLTVIVTVAIAAVLFADDARADDKAACLASYERTQILRKQNKLRAAREELLICARTSCPKLVQSDCAQWMSELTASLPSVVFEARDAQGRDRADVHVFIDGAPVGEQLGQEVTVDPGPHTLRFEREGSTPIEQEVVVRTGEKGRVVTIRFPEPASPAPTAVAKSSDRDRGRSARPLPLLLSPVLGAAGLAAVGVGSYLAISGSSQLADLRNTCAPHCEQADVDRLNLRYRIAAGVIGVGVVAIGVAVFLYVTRPTMRDRGTTFRRAEPWLTALLP
jgi:hypothetical protein